MLVRLAQGKIAKQTQIKITIESNRNNCQTTMLILKNLALHAKPTTLEHRLYLHTKFNFSQSKLPHHISPLNHYQTLGINPQASYNEIKKKFRQLSKIYHPDHYKGTYQKFHQIQNAYKILSEYKTRKQYDLSLGIANSTWQSEQFKLKSDKFDNEAFDQILNSEGKRFHEVRTLEQKLYQKFQKQINTQMLAKQKLKVLFWPCLGFTLFWATWNTFESILINYEGSQSHQVKAFVGNKKLSAIPMKIG